MEKDFYIEDELDWNKKVTPFKCPIINLNSKKEELVKLFEKTVNLFNSDSSIKFDYHPSESILLDEDLVDETVHYLKSIKDLFSITTDKRYRVKLFSSAKTGKSLCLLMNVKISKVLEREDVLKSLYRHKCQFQVKGMGVKVLHDQKLIKNSKIFGLQIFYKLKDKDA